MDVVLGDRYEIGALLGRGGMADVYQATDRALRREVAVKVLRDTADATHRARFLAEARTLAGLRHTAIIELLDAGLDERPYLVLELAEGRTLSEIIGDGPLEAARAARIGAQVADGLAHAHGAGVVHRDVKPSNVIVDDADRARLGDFGIAKMIGAGDGHTRTGETIGSPAYLAPEQVLGKPIGAAADVYSLGLALLEALTGRRAYDGSALEAAMARLHTAPLIPVSLGPTWTRLLDRMTRVEPTERPTAGEVARVLHDLADGLATDPRLLVGADDPLERTATLSTFSAPKLPLAVPVAVAPQGTTRPNRQPEVVTTAARRRAPAVMGTVAATTATALLGWILLGTSGAPAAPADTEPAETSTSTTPTPSAPSAPASPVARTTTSPTAPATTRVAQQKATKAPKQAPKQAPKPAGAGKPAKAGKSGKSGKGGPGKR